MPQSIKVPKYRKGEDLRTWVTLYDTATEMNGWATMQRLLNAKLYLPSYIGEWAIYQTYSSWDDFAAALLDRFGKRESIKAIVDKVLSLKMKGKGSSALKRYIRNFEKLYGRYHHAIVQSELSKYDDSSVRRTSQSPVVTMDETSFISTFLNALRPTSLQYAVKA